MAKVGYIFKENNDSFDAEREWMQRYGCVQIVEETVEHETLRPMWKQLMANLQRGDEIVISKFSNAARGLRELAAFIELCRIKIVRVISIHDRVDTRGELFPGTTAADVYNRGISGRNCRTTKIFRSCREVTPEYQSPGCAEGIT